jgi:hypothetical protein
MMIYKTLRDRWNNNNIIKSSYDNLNASYEFSKSKENTHPEHELITTSILVLYNVIKIIVMSVWIFFKTVYDTYN